jgi:hypothetical protein
LCKLGKQLGFLEGLLTGGLAFGPQGAEPSHILLNGAVDALLIQRQKLEILAFVDPGAGAGEGFVDGKLGGVVAAGRGEGAGLVEVAEGEDAGLDGTRAFRRQRSSAMDWVRPRSSAPTGWRDSRMPAQCCSKASCSSVVSRQIWPVRPWRPGVETTVEAGAMLAFFGLGPEDF